MERRKGKTCASGILFLMEATEDGYVPRPAEGRPSGGGQFIPHRNETSQVVTMDRGEETCI